MPNNRLFLGVVFSLGMIVYSCKPESTRFQLIDPAISGLAFSNTLVETDSIHYFNFPYIYTGAGIGIADFNKDGLQDIFFSGNMVSSKLYINQGDFRFEDLSQKAGIETSRWATGVSIVDINQDSWPDIYLSMAGFGEAMHRKNLLFINNRDLTFTESASAYGIADDGHSTQSAFFDYDQDGDLDLYVMTHANENYGNISKLYTHKDGKGPSTDRLYENIGPDSLGHPFYENISEKAGILIEGYGLGLAISDLNKDAWPDIYVANDFIANDLMYINQKDGTFANELASSMQHTSQNGMGVDIADINNDGLSDILVMDMLPESNHRQKTMTANMNYDHFQRTLRSGFSPQFIRNTLQLHRGNVDDDQAQFSEVGRLAGIYKTDWSWAPLFADFDNDGLLDLYISNGFRRDVTDHDFQEFHEQVLMQEQGSGKLSIPRVLEQLFQLDSVYLPNYMFHNQGDIQFENKTESWGLEHPSMSNGTAYADFDNDGDLDLVVNNINAPAFLYKNTTRQTEKNHYIHIQLEGPKPNRNAIGAKVHLQLANGQELYQENYPVRGYMSSIQTGLHFGLGKEKQVQRLEITWPDGKREYFLQVLADTSYLFAYGEGTEFVPDNELENAKENPLFTEVSVQKNISQLHKENPHSDFKLEPLLMHLYDQYGPGLAVGDVNGDGREDFFSGGARGQSAQLFFQLENGTFASQPLEDSEFYEDMGAIFFDADQDGDLDLYVVSGGSSVKYFHKGHYQDRLYVNDGKGNFTLALEALPKIQSSGSCVVATDFDKDGDLDLFVGGRVVPGKFPQIPRSYVLENQGGIFRDVTEKLAPGLAEIGMVSAALWTDYDGDADADLLLLGEWMPIVLFENQGGTFTEQAIPAFSGSAGWWNSLVSGDFDKDGDLDYVAGNLGRNTAFSASSKQPVRIYAKDFDQNGATDAILTRFLQGREYPFAPRGALIGQLESAKRLFPKYKDYSQADIHEILASYDTAGIQILEVQHTSSTYIENLGNDEFVLHPLPLEAQFAPIFGMEVQDVDRDGNLDILAVGNFYPTEVISGWYDAHRGLLLRGDGNGNFTAVSMQKSGIHLTGDARALTRIRTNSATLMVTSLNNAGLKAYQRNVNAVDTSIPFLPGENKAKISYKDGSIELKECYAGHGYLSQSSCWIELSPHIQSVQIFHVDGSSRRVAM